MLSSKHYDIILKHILYLRREPDTELNVMNIESDVELLFYLKVTKKPHNLTEYRFEIIFIFNLSTSITNSNASTTITEINPSTITSDVNNAAETNEDCTKIQNAKRRCKTKQMKFPPTQKRSLHKMQKGLSSNHRM